MEEGRGQIYNNEVLPKLCMLICMKHQEEMMSFCNSVDGSVVPSMWKVGVRLLNSDGHTCNRYYKR